MPLNRYEKLMEKLNALEAKNTALEAKMAESSGATAKHIQTQQAAVEAQMMKLQETISASDKKWDDRIEKAYCGGTEPPVEEETKPDPKGKKKKKDDDEALDED